MKYLLVPIFLLVSLSCSSSSETSGLLEGTFAGRIVLLTDQRDTVRQEVTIFIPAIERTTRSDTLGHWTLQNIPFGSYDLFATAPGYDTLSYYGVISSGGRWLLGDGVLGPNPSTQLKITGVTWSANITQGWPLTIDGVMDTLPSFDVPIAFAIFLDTVAGVSVYDRHFAGPMYAQWVSQSSWRASIDRSLLESYRFRSGMPLFITACTTSTLTSIASGYWNGRSSWGVFDPHWKQVRLLSPGPVSRSYETVYPW